MQQDSCYISNRTLSMSPHYFAKLLLPTRLTFSKSLAVFVGVSKFGKTNMIFADSGVPLCAADWAATTCHAWDLWRVLYLPARQCSCAMCTPHARKSAYIRFHFTRPVFSNVWTQLSTEFREKCSSGCTRRKSITLTNSCISMLRPACGLEQSVINDATNEWRRRLCVCIRAKGGHLSI